MGRFYETSQPHFIDNKMYEAPAELMAKVLMNKEKAVDDTIDSAEAYLEKLKAEALIQDTPTLQQRIKDYEGKISGIVSNIQANPMEYTKYQGDITQLGRDISADWTTGAIGTFQANKKKAEAEVAKLDDHLKLHPEDAEYVGLKKKEIFANYSEGAKWNDKTGKAEGNLNVDGTYYHPEFDDKFITQMKAKGYSMEKDTVTGAWINTASTDNKRLTQGEIQQAYIAGVKADPNYQAALRDWSKAGVSGYEDVDVNTIYTPRVDKEGNPVVDKDGQQIQDLNNNNFFTRKAIAAGIALEVKELGSKNTTKVNTHYEWEVDRQDAKEAASASSKENLLGSLSKEIILNKQNDLNLVNERYGNELNDFAFNQLKMPPLKKGEILTGPKVTAFMQKLIAKLPKGSIERKKYLAQNKRIGSLYKERLTIGYGSASEVIGTKGTTAVQKAVKVYTEDPANLYGIKGDFTIRTRNGSVINLKNKSFYDVKNHPEKYGFTKEDFNVGVTEYTDDENEDTESTPAKRDTKAKRTLNYYVKNSDMPIIMTDKAEKFDQNKNAFDFEVNGVPLHFVTTFKNLGIRLDAE